MCVCSHALNKLVYKILNYKRTLHDMSMLPVLTADRVGLPADFVSTLQMEDGCSCSRGERAHLVFF